MGERRYDVAVIGGGAVGAATAFRLAEAYPHLRLLLLEKERRWANHQTGNNSGVIHSGIYYKPGSCKAKNCVEGRDQLVEFCKSYDVKHEICGKIIVATDEKEVSRLDQILANGLQNGLSRIKLINDKEIQDIEPYCKGLAGIYVPYTGIVDYRQMTERMAELVKLTNPSNECRLMSEVSSLNRLTDGYEIVCGSESYFSRYLVTCGGLQADRLARMEGFRPSFRIVPFRGDYYDLAPNARKKVKNLVYPVPHPDFPFLGVHFTRMVDGTVECGPSAVFAFKREGYGKVDFSWKDTYDALTYRGTWNLFLKNWQYGLDQYRGAFSKRHFLSHLRKLIPSLELTDLVAGRSGVRAMGLKHDGSLVDDFEFAVHERSIHVLNAPSPAATACLAIGLEIVRKVESCFDLKR